MSKRPLRFDPTRTVGLMRPFCIRLRKAFREIDNELYALLVEEDAFGLKPVSHDPFTTNMAPNQPRDAYGRWVEVGYDLGDGTRSNIPKQEHVEKIIEAHTKALQRFKELGIKTKGLSDIKIVQGDENKGGAHATGTGITHKHDDTTEKEFESVYNWVKADREGGRIPSFAFESLEDRMIHEIGHNIHRKLTKKQDKIFEELYSKHVSNPDVLPSFYSQENSSELFAESVLAVVRGYRFGPKNAPPSEVEDFVRTHLGLSKPTINTRWRFETNPQKLKLFQDWLKKTLGKHLKNQAIDKLWEAYILEGFRKGAGRAFDDTKQEEGKKPDNILPSPQLDFYNGTKIEFLRSAFGQPETIEKVKLLASRTYDGMEGVTSTMATKMSRLLTDGLVQGMNPRTIANLLSSEINIGRARAETIARTELIRAHAEGQLMAFQKLGVEEVGAAVEWSTAGDERVCPLCRPLEGIVLKTSEATGMIPRHPNCRCAWIPAGVGEVNQKQLKTKAEIEAVITRSARRGKDKFKAAKKITKHRPEGVV